MILLMNVDKDNPSVAEGESVQIQGAGLTGFELKGNTEQDGIGTNNLFDGALELGSLNYDTGGNLENNDAIRSKNYIPIGSVTKFNIIREEAYLTGQTFAFRFYDSNFNYIGRQSANNVTNYREIFTNNSLDTSKTIAYMRFAVTTSNDLTKDFCVRTDNNTEYEPPSPNPDFPQQIEVVTGDNTINVHGKNLFDKTTITENQRLDPSGNNNYDENCDLSDYIKIQPNTTYTRNITASVYECICFYTINKTFISRDTTHATTTSPNNAYYVRISCYKTNLDTLQFEKGSSATAYEPYQGKDYEISLGNIELCKIGDYQDYIYKENNKWYKHSEIGKVVLNGGFSFGGVNNIFYSTFITDYATSNNIPYSNYYTGNTNVSGASAMSPLGNNTIAFINISGATTPRFYIKDTRYTTSNDLNTWLSTHNLIVYYVLATPTNTEITDTELKEDLEAISNIALFEGVNNISMKSSNLTSSFKVYYDTWYEFDKILRNGYNIREDRDRITQKFANGHRKQFVSDYVDCSITLNLDTIDKDTTQDYLQRLKSGAYKYYSIDGKEYRTAQFIIENKPELSVENSISNNVDVNEYQITLLKAGD